MARPESSRRTGNIKRLVRDKGFGFIADAEGAEYFFHRTAAANFQIDEVHEGAAVSFLPSQGPKGPRAEDVRLVDLSDTAF